MRKLLSITAAVCLCASLAVTAVSAQEGGGWDLTDLPELGFAISTNEGTPGTIVQGDVDVTDIEEYCLSIDELFDAGPPPSGEMVRFGAASDAYVDQIFSAERPVPGGLDFEQFGEAVGPIAALVLGVTALDEDGSNREALYENFFILTFADAETNELFSPTSNYDPATGEGEIEVPELDPGPYALAAACVNFFDDEELLEEGGAFDRAIPALYDWIVETYPSGPPPFDPDDPDFVEFVVDAASIWVPETLTPLAFGQNDFCILDEQGGSEACPAGEDGAIAGIVSDGEDPVAGAQVTLYPAEGQGRLDTTVTNSEGEYEFTELEPDSYRVRVRSPQAEFVTQWWDGASSWFTADDVVVFGGGAAEADFTVNSAGVIQGRIVNSYDEAHLAGATVRLYDAAGGLAGTATTGANGWFTFPGLDGGDYLVRVDAAGHQTQWYDQAWLAGDAALLDLGTGGNITLENVLMTPTDNGQFQGTVTDADTDEPIPGAAVRIYTADGFKHQVTTDSNGQYSLPGAAADTDFYIRFSAPGYAQQWWDQAGASFSNANTIVFGGGPSPETGVDAQLSGVPVVL